MNQFERVAIFTAIEGLEGQLLGLKKLVASISGAAPSVTQHKTTRIAGADNSLELSQDEEQELADTLKLAHKEEVAAMREKAEKFAQEEIKRLLGGGGGNPAPFIPQPPPHPLENQPWLGDRTTGIANNPGPQ